MQGRNLASLTSWRIKTFFSLFLAVTLIILAPPPAFCEQKEGHWDFTTCETFESRSYNHNHLRLEQYFRFRDGINVSRFTDLALINCSTRHFDKGLGFRTRSFLEKEKWRGESRPYLTATWKPSVGNLGLEFRNLLEYRIREAKEDYARYRLRLTIISPPLLDRMQLRPYVSEEIFIGLGSPGIEDIGRRRLAAGIRGCITRGIDFDVYAARMVREKQTHGGKVLDSNNSVGLKLKFRI